MSYYCVSPPDLLTPVLSLTSSNILAKPKSRCHSRFKSFFPRLLSPQGFKEAGELFISRDLAYCSVPLDFKLFLPGCPGAGSNTCHHMQHGHNTLIPTGSRTQQKKAQAEDQTWKEQKTEELLLPSVSGTEKWTQGKRQGRGIITFIPILFPQFPTTFEANFPLIKYTINDSSRSLLCKTIPNSPDGIILHSAQYTYMYIYIHRVISMASITLFCKLSKLFQNMFNILYFFETNSFIALPLFQLSLPPKEKHKPNKNYLPSFLEAIHLLFLFIRASEWRNLKSYWCLLLLGIYIQNCLLSSLDTSFFSFFFNSLSEKQA